MIKYACEEHLDEAMDDLINEFETFPIMEKCTDKQCSYCEKKSEYEIKAT